MEAWIILTIVVIWLGLPALLIVSACIHSSRLSRAEEAAGRQAAEQTINAMEPCNDKDASRAEPIVRVPTISR